MLTKQKIFDKVWNHFVYKGENLCFSGEGEPMYKTQGNSCAIGIFIPKSQYREDMEGRGVLGVCEEFPYVANKFRNVPDYFLEEIQDWHDEYGCSIKRGREIAKEFGLKIPRDGSLE